MKKSELRLLIRESLIEVLKENIFSEKLQSITLDDALSAARKLGVEKKVDIEELRKGMEVEQEHSKTIGKKDKLSFAKIALDHLKELPDYYTRLDKMEKKKEVSTSSATPGYMIPRAFQGKSKSNKLRRNKIARQGGYTVVGKDEEADNL